MDMKIKKGDTVKMMTGKDRTKTGKVLRVLSGGMRVTVEGLNLLTKHQRPRREGEKGQKIHFPRSVSIANVMLVCTKCGRGTRVGYRFITEGEKQKKVRMCKKCKELID